LSIPFELRADETRLTNKISDTVDRLMDGAADCGARQASVVPSDWKERVAKWAEDRNLVRGSSPVLQMNKLLEEVQELSDALLRNDTAEICDAIGDIQVVLAVMCAQLGQDVDQCREIAWEQIKDRKGKMIDGMFVKEV
jgi:NTP pyrophosphatase (non-canonical NTP hydrolase)